MLPSRAALSNFAIVAALALTGTALMAQPGRCGGPGWGPEPAWRGESMRSAPSIEGRIDVARFRADGTDALGGGLIQVSPMAEGEGGIDARLNATFEAAVEDRLLHSGYAAAARDAADGQIAEVRVVRSEAAPAEQKRMRVMALTITRSRSHPTRSWDHARGSLPQRCFRKARWLGPWSIDSTSDASDWASSTVHWGRSPA